MNCVICVPFRVVNKAEEKLKIYKFIPIPQVFPGMEINTKDGCFITIKKIGYSEQTLRYFLYAETRVCKDDYEIEFEVKKYENDYGFVREI